MINNGGSSPNFVKEDKDSVVVPVKDEEDEFRDNVGQQNRKKKPMSTFEVIFCFCCRSNKKRKNKNVKGGR